jgi:hypothetical protein
MRMIENLKLKSFGGGRMSKKRVYKRKRVERNVI